MSSISDIAPNRHLLHRRPPKETFCRSLIKPRLPRDDHENPTWPTRLQEGIEEVHADSEIKEVETPLTIDLDNDGNIDQAVSWNGHWGGGNGDESVCAILPKNAPDTAVKALSDQLEYAGSDKVNALRKSGITLFAGDLTSYRSIAGTHLTVFVRDKTTWMHAATLGNSGMLDGPTDIILRPSLNGTLDEVCTFHANLPL